MKRKVITTVAVAGLLFLWTPFAHSAQADKPFAGSTVTYVSSRFPQQEVWDLATRRAAERLGITVKTTWYGWEDAYNRLVLDAQSGISAWDVVPANEFMIPMLVEKKIIVPLGDLLPKDYDLKDIMFTPEMTSYKGKLWTVTGSYSNEIVAYRADLLADAGERGAFRKKYGYELRVPMTYKEFRDVAEFFTRKKGEKLAGAVLEHDFFGTSIGGKRGGNIYHDWMSYMAAFGGNDLEFNSKENIAAMEFIVGLKPFTPPEVGNMTTGENIAAFGQGRVAMIRDFAHNIPPVVDDPAKSKIRGKWAFALHPSLDPKRPHATHFDNFGFSIYALSKNKAAAARLWEETNSFESHKWMVLNHSYLTNRFSVMRDPEVQRRFPWFKQILEIESTRRFGNTEPKMLEFPAIRDVIGTALNEALVGEKPVKAALDDAQVKINELIRNYSKEEIKQIIPTTHLFSR